MTNEQKGRKLSSYYSELADQSVNKAGFIIYGDAPTAEGHFQRKASRKMERHIVAAWSEGRFKDKKIAYQLPKGGVDGVYEEIDWLGKQIQVKFGEEKAQELKTFIAESAPDKKQTIINFIAGMRESSEETGVNILAMLGPDNLMKLFKDEVLEHVQTPRNWGGLPIKIRCVSLNPVDDMVSISRNGSPLRTQLFAMQLEDNHINKLRLYPKLKNADALEEKGHHTPFMVKEPVREMRKTESFPHRDEILQWLTTGTMPKALWNQVQDVVVTMNDGTRIPKNSEDGVAFGDIQGNEGGEAFNAILEKIYNEPAFLKRLQKLGLRKADDKEVAIKSNLEFAEFYQYLAKHHPDDRETIKGFAKQMSGIVKDLNVTHGDYGAYKLDVNDVPGMIYQEGAQVMPLKDFFFYSLALASESRSYDKVMAGNEFLDKDGRLTIDLEVVDDLDDPLTPDQIADRLNYHKLARSQLGMLTSIARLGDLDINDIKRIREYHSSNTGFEDNRLAKEAPKTDFTSDVKALKALHSDVQAKLVADKHPLAAANEAQRNTSGRGR